ncbi:MAG TPA: urease accessory UreF family protein, partial [Chloroflexota bacterium]|nr:urease accessory UreF family protein [Chloroflexota bacterium]
LLATLQLADSAFPAGLYAFSHGLETAAQEGHVRTAEDLERFVADWLAWQVGPGDSVVVAASHRAAARGDLAELMEIDRYNAATKLPREARESSTKTGARLLATAVLISPEGQTAQVLNAFHQAVRDGSSPGTYAAAFGAATASSGVACESALLAELHGAATSILGAALRLLRIDHQQTQILLRRLAPLLTKIAAQAQRTAWTAIRPTASFTEILQMRHEAAHVRLFMS